MGYSRCCELKKKLEGRAPGTERLSIAVPWFIAGDIVIIASEFGTWHLSLRVFVMTEELKELLQQYGMVSVSLSHLASERPGNKFASLEEYYQSFGGLLPDEPAIVVRISKDGELRFLHEGEHDVSFQDKEGKKVGVVTVWEMPEDEFWFFKAFRPGLFDLDKDLPRFLYEMGVTYCYALFESYLSEILRYRFRAHPLMLGSQREMKYGDILEAKSKENLVDQIDQQADQ